MADDEDNSEQEVAVMTTLHYVLQTQRMGTISESTGRASMFLTSVSMTLIALGFIAQATELNPAFYAFTFALMAVLLLIGISTFLRLVELGAEDGSFAMASERIKEFYLAAAPRTEKWMALPPAKLPNIGEQAVSVRVPFQLLMTASSMVAMVNSALLGAGAALALGLGGSSIRDAALAGGGLFAIVLAAQLVLSRRIWAGVQRAIASVPHKRG